MRQTDDLAEPLYLALLAVLAGSYYGRLTWPRRTLPAEDLYLSGEFTVISLRLRIPIDSSIGFVRSCITGSRVAKKGKRCSQSFGDAEKVRFRNPDLPKIGRLAA